MNFRNSLVAAASTAAVIGSMSVPAQAANLFGNSGITFDKDTTLEFSFVSSNGEFKSNFGVYEVSDNKTSLVSGLITEKGRGYDTKANDYKGSCLLCDFTFKFLQGKTYTLGLESFLGGKLKTQTYSTDTLNSPVEQNAVFGSGSLSKGVLISFDDNGGPKGKDDDDLNDFKVNARSVPEPATLAGLGLAAGSLLLSRRRKASQSA
jgi:hypothetical protein